MRKAASLVIKIAVSAAIFVYVIASTGTASAGTPFLTKFLQNFSDISGRMAGLPAKVLFTGVFIYILLIFITTFRWQILLRDRGYKISFWRVLKYTMIGVLFNNIMPSTVGGDVIKAYYLHRDVSGHKKTAVFTIFMDRIIGALATCIFIFIGAFFLRDRVPQLRILIYISIAVAAAAAAAIFILDEKYLEKLSFYRDLPQGHPIRKLHYAFFYYKKEGFAAFFAALGVSLFVQIGIITLNYILMSNFSATPISYWYFVCIIPVANVIQSLPVSFAGWGIGEAAYKYLFSLIGVAAPVAVSTSIVNRLFLLTVSLFGLPVYITNKPAAISHDQESSKKSE